MKKGNSTPFLFVLSIYLFIASTSVSLFSLHRSYYSLIQYRFCCNVIKINHCSVNSFCFVTFANLCKWQHWVGGMRSSIHIWWMKFMFTRTPYASVIQLRQSNCIQNVEFNSSLESGLFDVWFDIYSVWRPGSNQKRRSLQGQFFIARACKSKGSLFATPGSFWILKRPGPRETPTPYLCSSIWRQCLHFNKNDRGKKQSTLNKCH